MYVNDSGGNDANDGSSWILAKKTILNATDNVNVNGTVNIANGQYTGVNNTNISIVKNMNIIGQSKENTIINGTGTNWIFNIEDGLNVTITNLTLTNGTIANGGAIYNEGILNVTDCTFTGNTAPTVIGWGGAIYNYPTGKLIVKNSTFNSNTATSGGAILSGGTLTVTDSTFTGNIVTNSGGAIYSYGTLTVTNSTFSNNTGVYSGAIGSESILNVTDSTFTGNKATVNGGDAGSAIYNHGGTLTVKKSTFTSNSLTSGSTVMTDNNGVSTVIDSIFTGNTGYGGGALSSYLGNLTVSGCNFTGNTAINEGGAILNVGNLTVTGSNFTGNTASINGGAISSWGIFGSTLTVTESTFSGNSANRGGAIDNFATAIVHFNRIVGNTATQGSAISSSEGAMNATKNWWGSNNPDFSALISGEAVAYTPWLYLTFGASPLNIPQGSTSTLTASFNQVFDGTTITQIDPVLGHIPDGTPVTFTTNLGNVGSKSVVKYTLNGIATAILSADEAAGNALISAFLDSQTPLTAIVTITSVANAATTTTSTSTIGMQTTGAPLAPLFIAVLSILGGLRIAQRK